MQPKRKKVLCIDSEPSFLEQQKKLLSTKELAEFLYPFNNVKEALDFIEEHIIEKNIRLHYIILDEKTVGNHSQSFEKIWNLNHFLHKPDIIITTEEKNTVTRNRIMQYSFVSVFLVKPVPTNYIEFLITGQPQ